MVLRRFERGAYSLGRLLETIGNSISQEQERHEHLANEMSHQVRQILSSMLRTLRENGYELHAKKLLTEVIGDLYAGGIYLRRGDQLEHLQIKTEPADQLKLMAKSIPTSFLSPLEQERIKREYLKTDRVLPLFAGFFGRIRGGRQGELKPHLEEIILAGADLSQKMAINARAFIFWNTGEINYQIIESRLGPKDRLTKRDQEGFLIDFYLGRDESDPTSDGIFLSIDFEEVHNFKVEDQAGQEWSCLVAFGTNLGQIKTGGGKRVRALSEASLEEVWDNPTPSPAY